MIIAARLLLVIAGACLLPLTGCDEEPGCVGEETVSLKMSGNCAPDPQRFVLRRHFCSLTIEQPSGPLGIPRTGAVDQAQERIREGGWQIYGYLCPGDVPCTDPAWFRQCRAKRVDFHLELTCKDGRGMPVCQARLTE